MLTDLEGVRAGDVVLLHGCCHNPTGANLNITEWKALVDLLIKTGATPMVDIAYQGFGDGLEEDAAVAGDAFATPDAARGEDQIGYQRYVDALLM